MHPATRPHNIESGTGQHGPRPFPDRLELWAVLALLLASACHRLPTPGSPVADPRLPAAYRTPADTFRTWAAASLAGEPAAIRACYWDGLGKEEMASWLRAHSRPEAAGLFEGATWLGIEPVSPVEVDFSFRAATGDVFRGVMVRTAGGWKVQSW
ncbi:MAG: hypothetical protein JXR96_07000 [Deltaproteobacteria bacterium]|nr:hypothetical protein [Deltaproteobacteria bacterium]